MSPTGAREQRWSRSTFVRCGRPAGLAFHQQQPALERRPGARGRSAKRPGHNLLVRLRDFKTEVLRFLFDFAVPFTNN
jgi:transposase